MKEFMTGARGPLRRVPDKLLGRSRDLGDRVLAIGTQTTIAPGGVSELERH